MNKMIKIYTEIKNANVSFEYEHKESCLYEHIILLERIFQEIENQMEMSREEIYEILKDYEKINFIEERVG